MSNSSETLSPAPAVPPCPNGLINFPADSSLVEDADEEIMELYMNLASTAPDDTQGARSDDSGGLGFLDSTKSILELSLDVSPPASADAGKDVPEPKKRRERGVRKEKAGGKGVESVQVKVQQDLTALKGRKGDTGSVLWRSSLHLARLLLTQHYHPSPHPLFEPDRLRTASILELGAGTGLLALLLGPICGRYTASDRFENLKLVKRNLDLNGLGAVGLLPDLENETKHSSPPKRGRKKEGVKEAEVILEEIDWVEVSEEMKRHRHEAPKEGEKGYDLVLAVDCIYNEHLVQPLVDTLARYCPVGGDTVVWVVVELRSADVLTTFLDKWLNDPSGPWTIVRLGGRAMGQWEGKRARWVGWVGWR
ncbi:hypothetical protein IAT38_005998 [Cryptococcus sp. DSM 104549]